VCLQLPELDHYLRKKDLLMFGVANLVFWIGFLLMFVLAMYEEQLEEIFT
jgi:hypothetical protein